MKVGKSLLLIAFAVVMLVVVMFKDKLLSYAETTVYTEDTLIEGKIFKSGEPFKFEVPSGYCNSAFSLNVNIDGNFYSYPISFEGEIGTPTSNGLIMFVTSSANNPYFEQKVPGTFPYVDGKSILWTFKGDSDTGFYCSGGGAFMGTYNPEPVLDVLCDSTVVSTNRTVDCQVTAEYIYGLDGLEFDLTSDKFDILDVHAGEQWESEDNNGYKLTADSLPYIENADSPYVTDVLTFKLKAKEKKNGNYDDAVVLDNVKYTVDYVEESLDTKEKEPMKVRLAVNEKVENPETGVSTYVALSFVLLAAGALIFVVIKKKGLFRKI